MKNQLILILTILSVFVLVLPSAIAPPDNDGDNIPDPADNCPDTWNPFQEDADEDGYGDACDDCPLDPENDVDEDGICGDIDNCPYTSNPNQEDTDEDGVGDACEDPNKNYIPVVSISYPRNMGRVKGNIIFMGQAFDNNGEGDLDYIMINIDNTGWINAEGTTDWTYSFDTTTVEDGIHTFSAVAFDKRGSYSPVKSIGFNVTNNEIEPPKPDLECTDSCQWSEVKPNEVVGSIITISNIGEPESLLDWEIVEYPEWDLWDFAVMSGEDIAVGENIFVGYELTAPDVENMEFNGNIKIVNSENLSNVEYIEVTLITPKNKLLNPFVLFFWRIIDRFPLIELFLW